jgi:hypothetical protein
MHLKNPPRIYTVILAVRRLGPQHELSCVEFETLHAILLETDWVTRGALSIVYASDVQKRGVSPSTEQMRLADSALRTLGSQEKCAAKRIYLRVLTVGPAIELL